MTLLKTIHSPVDLRCLTHDQLVVLAWEIRQFLVDQVCRTGGHLGPNLGVVELTLALHRVFNSPRDTIVWDTGHQTYVHKIVTGRAGEFPTLRQAGGISGYPSRTESVHDLVENSHASTALSYADGLAKAYTLRGQSNRAVVAVVGDGALTGGMCWEALNNIAAAKDRPMVIVVNDNQRSYAPTIGGLANHLATLRTTRGYESFLDWGRRVLSCTPVVGRVLFDTLHGLKKGIKDIIAPQAMFEDLGLKYLGPVDGHDVRTLESVLRRARGFGGPVIVHCITRKGLGYPPAEADEIDHFHGIGVLDPDTGCPVTAAGTSWTSVFADEMVRIGAARPDVVGVSAAMLNPVGLHRFAHAYPERVFDVGIAEQHAVTSAAGLALGGCHPVVAVYATFLNRAFDQVLMDVALHRLPVTFVLDRAGVTGPDGASHHGMWDLSLLQIVPGLRVAAPRDAGQLRRQLWEAVNTAEGPTVLRLPKATIGPDIPALDTLGGTDVLARNGDTDVLVICVGVLATTGLQVAQRLVQQGVGVTVMDPRWVKPLDPAVAELAGQHRLVATVEDGIRVGGVGAAIAQALSDAGVPTPVRTFGLPPRFLPHGSRAEILDQAGLSVQQISRTLVELIAHLGRPFATLEKPL